MKLCELITNYLSEFLRIMLNVNHLKKICLKIFFVAAPSLSRISGRKPGLNRDIKVIYVLSPE